MGGNDKNRSNSAIDPEEFDWSAFESKKVHGLGKEAVFAAYESALPKLKVGEIVEGKVTAINWKDVTVNLNYKTEGLVPTFCHSEIKNDTGYEIGGINWYLNFHT